MAKLASARRIVSEDFDAKDRALIDKLSYTINPFLDSVINALNGQLTLGDNLKVSDITVEIKTPIVQNNRPRVLTKLGAICRGIVILNIENLTNNDAILTAAPFIEFNNISNNEIEIKNITGLDANSRYSFRLVLFP